MQTVTIQTSQNIGIDYEVAGLGERILARLIDYVPFIVLFFFGLLLISTGSSDLLLYYYLTVFGLFIFYDLVCEMLFDGQSIGKRALKIRVISLDGGRPTISQYLLRWLFRLVDFGITGNLGGLLCAALTPNVQRIGDVVAGTTMIKTQPRTKIEHLAFAPTEDDYQPTFAEVRQLNEKDISLINDVIHNYYKTGNTTVIYSMADKVRETLKITPAAGMNDLQFLQAVIKDFAHFATHADTAL